ncbi:MAG: M28 family peptidase [Acidobacteria bacterium]|nr:M28 family peptidase [Acidobacteriota bacterium]
MKRLAIPAFFSLLLTTYAQQQSPTAAQAEKVMLDTPSPERARQWLMALTEEPHVAGTPAEQKVAEWVRDRFKEFGLDVEMIQYNVFLNHPKKVSLRMTVPREENLSLKEDVYPQDKDSIPDGQFPAFHGYGASGKAAGQIVYVNYGSPADFERLRSMGISVAGRIVLVRYGGAFRGLKVKEAQDRGAAGVLIYSDPADDGYMKGDVYPDGPMRPASAIQRGSVLFLSHVPGDPSTPGYASTATARRLTRSQMENVPNIPSLPISYREAEKLLRQLGGTRVPDAWQGGLPFAYHIGPGVAAVEMEVEMDEGLKPIHNVIARIPGAVEPDRWIILGNHRDAWTPGAVDPNSGTAVMIETARALSAAMKTGWRPRRTILLCNWDGEEYGLVGSTEWAEEHEEELQRKTVAYLNLDSAVTGPDFGASGTPSLRDLVRQTIADIPEPKRGGMVGTYWERRLKENWASSAPVALDGAEQTFELQLGRLGSGSDYTAFLDYLGIPSVDFSFSGGYGVYHSIYDNFFWMSRFADPEFIYHQAAARFYGLLAMRAATAKLAPLRFSNYGPALMDDINQIRIDVIRRARTAEGPAFRPDFTGVLEAIRDFDSASREADKIADRLASSDNTAAVARFNDAIIQVERAFLNNQGLPKRPWFRHQLIAPGLTTGYAPWPFPGLREAVEKRDTAMFEAEAKKVVAALRAGLEKLRTAAR